MRSNGEKEMNVHEHLSKLIRKWGMLWMRKMKEENRQKMKDMRKFIFPHIFHFLSGNKGNGEN